MSRVRARGAAAEAASPEANAISNQKRLPMPARLSTPIRPPIASTRRLQIARPSPEPPNRRRTDPSAWANGRKRIACCEGGMPMPVSRTSKRSRTDPAGAGSRATVTATRPCSVNLSALPTRLSSTWRRRVGSPWTAGRRSPGNSKAKTRPRSTACGFRIDLTSSTRRGTSKSAVSSWTVPASIRETSSTSSMTARSCRPEARMAPR